MENNKGELNMSVSAICQDKAGKKYAFVSFTDGVRTAEGKIPACKITANNGFAALEVQELEKYMEAHLTELKKMAAGIDIFSAFTKN
ncbi:MAG: hypothetical protein K6E79_05895 [Pseudobutyrivibrio sp.]|nr:hypothetical protein [Pseudobutyrivibrio sp.]